MKNYLKHFRFLFITIGIMLVIVIALSLIETPEEGYVRANAKEAERVFDYADKLTDEEEDALRKLIAEKEDLIGCDIVLVTIDDPTIDSDYAMMNYADDFYDEREYGFNEPWGDGALYLDNWANGYCWLSTSGRMEDRYSTQAIDNLINKICLTVNSDPYGAYRTYVESVGGSISSGEKVVVPITYYLGAAFVITFVYVLYGLVHNKGKKTTTASTYVAGGQPLFHDRRDIFISKNTTRRHIDRSSGGGGGGGGGHHISSGGHSHGGGGGRH